jgi:CrcB protein
VETLTKYLVVAAGGALGAILRFYLGGSVLSRTAAPFPTATFVINITGSFIIGFFLTLATERMNLNPHWKLLVAVGFIGAYTTFSTFEYETARLVEDGDITRALLYILLSVVVGFVAVWAGMMTARKVEHMPLTSRAAYERFARQADPCDPSQGPGAEADIRDSSINPGGNRPSKTPGPKRT